MQTDPKFETEGELHDWFQERLKVAFDMILDRSTPDEAMEEMRDQLIRVRAAHRHLKGHDDE